MFKSHVLAFIIGFVLDQIIGDPWNMPHPIRLIGTLISKLTDIFLLKRIDKKRNNSSNKGSKKSSNQIFLGTCMWIIVVMATFMATFLIMFAASRINVYVQIVVEAVLTCYILAAKSLRVESMKVYYALKNGTLEDARYAVSMIVGRDTNVLDKEGVIKAAVETVAENTSDGVIAPLIYTFFFGPIGGFVYKAINTMDSMVGYHNEKYEYFGKTAAKMDDIFNYIPARISALLMIAASFILGKRYSGRNALKIFKRDRYNHKSPNSAQTESACAGALSLRLAGNAVYFGKMVEKPYIGDNIRDIELEDIKRACILMYATEYLCMIIFVLAAVGFILL